MKFLVCKEGKNNPSYIYMKKAGISLALEGFQIKDLSGATDVSGPVAPIEGGGWTAPPSNEIDLTAEAGGNFFDVFDE